MRGLLTAIGMATTLAFAAPAAAQFNPAFDYDTADTEILEDDFTLGFSFTLSQAATINALGFWIPGNLTSNEVAIWDINGNLLTSTTVQATDPARGDYRYSSINPLFLDVGEYVIGGHSTTGGLFPIFLTGVTTAPGYTWTGQREMLGSALAFPAQSPGGLGDQSAALVNFSFVSPVPEPATWTMMLLGFGGVGMVIRRRRKTLRLAHA